MYPTLVHGCTERAPRQQRFHVDSHTALHHFNEYSKRAVKRLQSLIQNHVRQERSQSARERRTALRKSDQQQQQHQTVKEKKGLVSL